MILVVYKAIAALLIFLTSFATVIYPLKKKILFKQGDSLLLGEALASGIFLGAAFFHMLPDAIKLFATVYGHVAYPVPEAVCVLGFLLLLLLENMSQTESLVHSQHTIPYLLTTILVIHALVEGTALGIGSTISEAIMLFIAIIAHKGSESFALCVTLMRHQLPFKRTLIIITFFALMTPLGIVLGTAVNHMTHVREGELIAALFNAFAAGTFLYISTLHHIRAHKHEASAQGLPEFGCLVLGATIMGVIAIWT